MIAVLRCSSGLEAQRFFGILADQWKTRWNIAGLIEEPDPCNLRDHGAGVLAGVGSDVRFHIAMDNNCENGCNLSTETMMAACAYLEDAILAGPDLIVLNKFGRMEAARSGMISVFGAAISAGIPVLTYVAPIFRANWDEFAAPCYTELPCSLHAIEAWYRSARP